MSSRSAGEYHAGDNAHATPAHSDELSKLDRSRVSDHRERQDRQSTWVHSNGQEAHATASKNSRQVATDATAVGSTTARGHGDRREGRAVTEEPRRAEQTAGGAAAAEVRTLEVPGGWTGPAELPGQAPRCNTSRLPAGTSIGTSWLPPDDAQLEHRHAHTDRGFDGLPKEPGQGTQQCAHAVFSSTQLADEEPRNVLPQHHTGELGHKACTNFTKLADDAPPEACGKHEPTGRSATVRVHAVHGSSCLPAEQAQTMQSRQQLPASQAASPQLSLQQEGQLTPPRGLTPLDMQPKTDEASTAHAATNMVDSALAGAATSSSSSSSSSNSSGSQGSTCSSSSSSEEGSTSSSSSGGGSPSGEARPWRGRSAGAEAQAASGAAAGAAATEGAVPREPRERGLSPPPGNFRVMQRLAQVQHLGGPHFAADPRFPGSGWEPQRQRLAQMAPRPGYYGYSAFGPVANMPFLRGPLVPPPYSFAAPVPYGFPPRALGYGRLERESSRRRGERREGRGRGRAKRPRREGRSSRPRRKHRCLRDPPTKVGEGEAWETSREETSLQLVGEMAPPGIQWQYCLRDESRRSYVGYLQGPVPKARRAELFAKIRDGTIWRQPIGHLGVEIPRKTAWMVAPGCECTYRYGGIEVQPQIFPDWMSEVMALYMPFCGLLSQSQWPDSCNVNLYEDGLCSVGWHSDDEALFAGLTNDIRILSLSLGQSRKFQLKKNWPEEGEKDVEKIVLNDGAVCTMEGMLQKHYQHRIPKESEELGPRINLTWRWIAQHSKVCPACR